jgi:hypothetical protein
MYGKTAMVFSDRLQDFPLHNRWGIDLRRTHMAMEILDQANLLHRFDHYVG